MPLVINTNMAAVVASNHLASSNAAVQKSMDRMSTGKRINSSSDDAGGMGVSALIHSRMQRQVRLRGNLNNSMSFLQVQAGALQMASKILDRMSELKTMSLDITKNSDDRENYDKEFMELQLELRSISKGKFNRISLFTGPLVKDHALQTIAHESESSTRVVSLARNFLAGEYLASSGEVLGGREFNLITSTTNPLPVDTASVATGVDADGNKLPTGAIDPNWSVTGPTSVERLSLADQPGPWADETPTAGWIGKAAGGNGDYFYSMSFDLSGCDLSQVQIQGLAATDNAGNVLVNGQDLGLSFPNEYRSLQAFDLQTNANGMLVDGATLISNPLVDGINEVTVRVNNSGGPTGLLFDELQISASRIVTTQVASNTITYPGLDQFSMEDFAKFEQNLANALAENGSEEQRIRYELENLETNQINLGQAHGRIMDLDYAKESTRLIRQQILSQSSAEMVGSAIRQTEIAKQVIGI